MQCFGDTPPQALSIFKMAGLGFVKWLLPLGIGGAIGLFFWSGMSVLAVKTVVLWLLISFGFLTLIFHASGSSLLGLIGKLFGSEEKAKPPSFTEEELIKRRQKALLKKQGAFDTKNEQFKQNVMKPKENAQLLRKQAEFQKFHPHWRGEGNRLGNTPPEHICTCGQAHEIDTDDIEDDSLLDYIEDSQSESEGEELTQEEQTQSPAANTLRQRKKNKTDNHIDNDTKGNTLFLHEEPESGSQGTITVAFRCPNGETKKRRFHVESHIQGLFDFAETLGYSFTDYCIMMTYPRKPLLNATQTLTEAGLTQDIVLVIDDREE